jgi:hypothetical protein
LEKQKFPSAVGSITLECNDMTASAKRKAATAVEYTDDHAANLFYIFKSDLEDSGRFLLSKSGITLDWQVWIDETAPPEDIEVRTISDFRACLNRYYLPVDGFSDEFLTAVFWRAIEFVNSRAIQLDECGRVEPETANA